MAIPRVDSQLVPFSTNFNDRVAASPGIYGVGLNAEQATAYTALHTPYISSVQALNNARAAGTRSESMTATSNTARNNLLAYRRALYSFVQANTSISNADKIDLGVKILDTPSTVPPPEEAPGVSIVSSVQRTVTIGLRESAGSKRRGKPAAAVAAWVYSFVGNDYPADPTMWDFKGAATKDRFDIVFPNTVASGAKVWVLAAWINGKQEPGPTSLPVSTDLQGGGTSSATAAGADDAEMKIAA